MVIDLERVTTIDAGGLGILVGAHVEFAKAGGELRLAHVRPKVLRLIRVGGLDTVFDIFSDQLAAIANFRLPDVRLDIGPPGDRYPVRDSSLL